MKTIVLLTIIGYALSAQQEPLAASYCMGANTADANCAACYNYGLGTIGPRYKSSSDNLCTNKLTNLVTDCLRYNPVKTSTTLAVTDCQLCNAKTWLNITAGTVAIACATAAAPTAAAATGQACAAVIQNCDQNVCHANGTTYKKLCAQCAATYSGATGTTAELSIGYAGCEARASSSPIGSCKIYDPLDRTMCYECDAGKSVDANGQGCTTLADTNCRKFSSGGSYCGECKTNYHFNKKLCQIGYTAPAAAANANLMAAGALFMTILAFFN